MGFDILYEDAPCLVVAKPGGVLTQAPPNIDSLEVRVKRRLQVRDQIQGEVYLGVPHRLDRPVSGAILFAKRARAARRLSRQFEGRTVRKEYRALVEGRVDPPQGEWTDYVRKVPGEARAEIVDREVPGARIAILHYRVLQSDEGRSWLEIESETGRMHQLRVQAASRSRPILGDRQYGSTVPFGPQTEDERERWIALHARSLTFRHPKTRRIVSVVAPLPEAWRGLGLDESDAPRS
jgi:RluA family pseudouridine synthase